MFKYLTKFFSVNRGAISMDWLALGAAILLFGAAVQISFDQLILSTVQYGVISPLEATAMGARPENMLVENQNVEFN